MRAGQLNKRVTIKRNNRDTRNEFGEVEPTDVVVGTVWASVKPMSSKERVYGSQVSNEITHLVEMRYRADVAADYFLEMDGRTLRIDAVFNVDEKDKSLQLQCKEID